MSGTLTGSGPWGLGERPYHKKNRLITISRRLPRRGCKIKIAPSNSSTAPDLGHSPLVGSEAATEVFNPAAPPFSPPYTTLSTSRPGLHAHHRSNLSKLRPRCTTPLSYVVRVATPFSSHWQKSLPVRPLRKRVYRKGCGVFTRQRMRSASNTSSIYETRKKGEMGCAVGLSRPERARKQRILNNRGGEMYLIRLGPRGPGLASAARPRAESALRPRLQA